MQVQYRDPKDSVKQINSFAHKVLRRIHRLGAKSQTLDDVKQELWFAWCKACETYRPECGASFSTYFYRGMQVYINRYIEKNFERFHDQTIALSLDSSEFVADGESSLSETIADEKDNGYVDFERENSFRYALTRLSPRAQQFITILKEQPQDLLAEVRKLEEKSAFARSRGVTYASPQRLTSPVIFDFMGASRCERKKIMDELTQIGALLSN